MLPISCHQAVAVPSSASVPGPGPILGGHQRPGCCEESRARLLRLRLAMKCCHCGATHRGSALVSVT